MNGSSARILLVDDNQDTLDLFSLVLSLENYDVVTASTLNDALEETKPSSSIYWCWTRDFRTVRVWTYAGASVESTKRYQSFFARGWRIKSIKRKPGSWGAGLLCQACRH